MKTSIIKMIVTIAAVGLLANAALAKNGNNGGNHSSNGGNRSAFKLSSGSSNRSLGISSSSSSSNKVFKLKSNNSNNISSNSTISSKVFKLSDNNGNNNHNSIFSSNKNSNSIKLFSGNKDKKDFCFDGKCFPKNCHNGYCYPNWYSYCHSYPSYPCYGHVSIVPIVLQAFEPFHCNYVVLPGDSCFSIAFREYGTSVPAKYIAMFNGMPLGSSLAPGQVLQLPSVSPNGALAPSNAPIADALRMSPVVANFSQPAGPVMMSGPTSPMNGPIAPMTGPIGPMSSNGSVTPAAPADMTAPRPKVTVGSSLQVDGQSFGDKPGIARLQMGGVALKIEVLEWLGSAVKIRLPQLDLAGATNADIEVLRADGSLASKTPVELTSATEVALAK